MKTSEFDTIVERRYGKPFANDRNALRVHAAYVDVESPLCCCFFPSSSSWCLFLSDTYLFLCLYQLQLGIHTPNIRQSTQQRGSMFTFTYIVLLAAKHNAVKINEFSGYNQHNANELCVRCVCAPKLWNGVSGIVVRHFFFLFSSRSLDSKCLFGRAATADDTVHCVYELWSFFFFQQSDWCCWCDSFCLFCRHHRRVCCPIYHFLSVSGSLRRSADRNFCRTVSQAVASRLITRLLLYNNGSLAFRWRMGEDSMSGSERMDLRIEKIHRTMNCMCTAITHTFAWVSDWYMWQLNAWYVIVPIRFHDIHYNESLRLCRTHTRADQTNWDSGFSQSTQC